jgi:hypothetical protein
LLVAAAAGLGLVGGLLLGYRGVSPSKPRKLEPLPRSIHHVARQPRRVVEGEVKLVANERERPNEVSADVGGIGLVYFPRDPEEWQGRLVETNFSSPCARASDCARARACRDGSCGPCLSDEDCSEGESCVLDQCLIAAQSQCRTRRDCSAGEKCMIYRSGSNAFTDPRGNQFLIAECTDRNRLRSLPQVDKPEINAPPPLPFPAPESDVVGLTEVFQTEG